jgi:hypothetical protein
VPRQVRVHPLFYWFALVITWEGMPYLLNWVTGQSWLVPENVLPAPRSKRGRQGIAKGSHLRTDATWHYSHGLLCYIVSTRGDICALRFEPIEKACSSFQQHEDTASQPSNKRQRTGNGFHAPTLSFTGCSPQPENTIVEQMHVYRMSYTYTSSLPISPPEIRHSRHNQFLTVATRAGVILYAEDTLECVDKGYAETVDNTPLVQSRLAFNDRLILALPHPKSGHMAGGLYFFRRGAVGDIRLKAGPGVAGGIVYMDVHPRMQLIIGTHHTYTCAPCIQYTSHSYI